MRNGFRFILLALILLVLVAGFLVFISRDDAPAPTETEVRSAKREVRSAESEVGTGEPRGATEMRSAQEPVKPLERQIGAGPGRIFVSVVDEEGNPAASAAVLLQADDYKNPNVDKRLRFQDNGTTDSEGRYEFARVPLELYLIKATTERAVGLGFAHPTEMRPIEAVEITLEPSWRFSGRVVDSTNQPVPKALVVVVHEKHKRYGYYAALQEECDEQGAFTFAHLPRGEWQFMVQAQGYAHFVSDFVPHTAKDVVFVLEAGGGLAGKVVMAGSREAVPDIEVIAKAEDIRQDQTPVKTGQNGEFQFAMLRPADYRLLLTHERLVLAQEPPVWTVSEGKETSDITIEIIEGGSICGVVIDADTRAGIPGARLYAYPVRDCIAVSRSDIKTGLDGAYCIDGLGVGRYRIQCFALNGYKNPEYRAFPVVSLAAGQRVEGVDFELPHASEVTGIVQDVEGNPVAGAQVGARTRNATHEDRSFSGPDGRFSLSGFCAGQDILIFARKGNAENYRSSRPLVVGEHGLHDLVITLNMIRNARIEGDVVDQRGRPLENVGVMASPETESMFDRLSETTDGQGRFKFCRLAAGTYQIWSRLPKGQHASSPGRKDTVVLGEGEQRTGVRLVIDTDDRRSIAGRVMNAQGTPLKDAQISAEGPTHVCCAYTKEDGRYELLGLEEGYYSVSVKHHLHGSAQRDEVRVGSKGVDFRLEGCGSIEGRVVSAATREPITDFSVVVVEGSRDRLDHWMSRNARHVHDPDGAFVVAHVQPGANTVVVEVPGFATAYRVVTGAVAGKTTSGIEIALGGGAVVEGVVVNNAGEPIRGARIYLGGIPNRWERQADPLATTRSDGAFRIDLATTDEYRLTACREGYAPASVMFNPRAGHTEYVEVVLRAGGQIEGVVTQNGEPIVGVRVSATRLELGPPATVAREHTKLDGSYTLAGLPEGEYLIGANLPGPGGSSRGRHLERPAVVAPQEVTEVDFDFTQAKSVIEGVVTVQGKPAQEGYVNGVIQASGSEEHARSQIGPDGSYRLEPVPAGHVEMTVRAGGRSRIVALDVPAGKTVRQDVDFQGAATLSGTVAGVIPGAERGVGLLAGEPAFPTTTSPIALLQYMKLVVYDTGIAEDGTYRIEAIDPGVYTVVAYSLPANIFNVRYAYSVITIEVGDDAVLDFTLNALW